MLTFAGQVYFPFGQTFFVAVDGAITLSGSLIKQVGKALGGTLATSGAFAYFLLVLFAGTIATSSAITWTVSKRLAAHLTPVGRLVKQVAVDFAGLILSITSRLRFGRRGRVGTGHTLVRIVGTEAILLSTVDTGAATLATVDTGAAPADAVGAEADLTAIVGADHE